MLFILAINNKINMYILQYMNMVTKKNAQNNLVVFNEKLVEEVIKQVLQRIRYSNTTYEYMSIQYTIKKQKKNVLNKYF